VSWVDSARHFRRTYIGVPRDRIAVLAQTGIIELADGTAPEIVVVVEDPDLCGNRVLLKQRSQMILHETDFVLLRQGAGRHSTVLIGIYFVLHGDSLNRYALGSVGLQKLQKVLSVRRHESRAHGTAEHRAAPLHPS